MPLILNIETSTAVCSVAISKNADILYSKESIEDKSHASSLAVFIDEGMKKCKLSFNDLNAVAISKGPGSYTGLRIGVSTAKGICYGANKPLIAINTLKIMASGVINNLKNHEKYKAAWFCPMIDARRMEVFTAFFNINLKQITKISADIVNENSYNEIRKERPIFFFGDGIEKIKNILKGKNVNFIDNIHPLAKDLAYLALDSYNKNEFVDVAYFEPFYLKDFIATKPKKNVFM